jgi:hypothetical protein
VGYEGTLDIVHLSQSFLCFPFFSRQVSYRVPEGKRLAQLLRKVSPRITLAQPGFP